MVYGVQEFKSPKVQLSQNAADDNSDVASLDVRCYMEDVPILHKPDKHSQYLLVWQDVFG